MTERRIVRTSHLAAMPEEVWRRISTLDGVNDELRPLARMTQPGTYSHFDPSVPLGQCLGRSWILLLGVVPVDYDDLCFAAITPGRGFHETSTMLSQKVWVHRREISAVPGGCRLTDHVSFVPRIVVLAALYHAVFGFFFTHRHSRLRRRFGVLVDAE